MNHFPRVLVELPPPEIVIAEVPAEEKVEDKKKDAMKNKKKGKSNEVEPPPVVSRVRLKLSLELLHLSLFEFIINYSIGYRSRRRGSTHMLTYFFSIHFLFISYNIHKFSLIHIVCD